MVDSVERFFMQKLYRRTWAEIYLDRLEYNLNICNSFLNENTEIMAVVKANAYGHGDNAIAPYLQSLGINYFAVSNINEAMHIRKCGITKEILILGYVSPCDTKELFDFNIIQTVTSFEHAKSLSDNTPSGKKLRVHIKIDTGMGRIGLKKDSVIEYVDEIEKILSLPNIKVEGIFSHFAAADSDDSNDIEYTKMQYQLLTNINNELKNRGINIQHVHCLNSAGATYHENANSTLARFGIMLYGLHPNYSLDLPKPLKPVMELKTIISHVKTVKSDEYIRYGRTFKSNK